MTSANNRPKRWSYSSLSTWKQCARKWKYSYIDNLPWPSSPAMTRGSRMHLMAEEYVKNDVIQIPHEIHKIGPLLEMLKAQKAIPEAVWMLDQNWEPTPDPDKAWVKAIVDVHYVLENLLFLKDYKSGQMYDDHRGQLELYGIIGLKVYPQVKRVESSAVYMDSGHEGMQGSLIRDMLPKMITLWDNDAKAMMNDNDFIHNPGAACRWCPYAKTKGGPCDY